MSKKYISSLKLSFILAAVLCLMFTTLYGLGGQNGIDRALLDRHNYYREIAGIPPMKWNSNIAANAQKWANYLKKRNCQMQHSSLGARKNAAGFNYLGENLYSSWSSAGKRADAAEGKKAVTSWYSEIRDFQYSAKGVVCSKRNNRGAIGHFTQVMWDKSINLGCGYAVCGGRSLVIVCQYGPGGNFNMRSNPPFDEKAAAKLDRHPINKKYGGLPRCDK